MGKDFLSLIQLLAGFGVEFVEVESPFPPLHCRLAVNKRRKSEEEIESKRKESLKIKIFSPSFLFLFFLRYSSMKAVNNNNIRLLPTWRDEQINNGNELESQKEEKKLWGAFCRQERSVLSAFPSDSIIKFHPLDNAVLNFLRLFWKCLFGCLFSRVWMNFRRTRCDIIFMNIDDDDRSRECSTLFLRGEEIFWYLRDYFFLHLESMNRTKKLGHRTKGNSHWNEIPF